MKGVRASYLGQFAVTVDGQPVEIPYRASQSLFAYLVLTRETPHRRELLAGMFWPDSSEANARNNLRHALWQIRSALGEDMFLSDKLTVSLNPEIDIVVDADRLDPDATASLEVMSAAADIYQGDLLPGFYDDWVILERERLRGAYARLMERLLEGLIEARRWGEVSEWGERWIAMGHVPEPAFRALMVAHAAKGNQVGVEAVYQQCVDTLERELGVEPSPQTRLLHEQLMAGDIPLAAAPTKERYELGEEIGRGGMGEVYRARDTWLDREVAVKVLSSEILGSEGRQRLLAEAQAAARLNHPNVVSVYDVGEIEGQPFIVMELVEGETLHDHRPENQADTLSIILEICAALEHAHAQGIVHRDLKPENVMLAPDGMARLMDFGLASRTIEAPQAPKGGTAGTVYYLAPEVLQGEAASVQSDLYALGVLLYELLTGELPFSGEDPMAVISQHLEAEPKPPSELNPEIRPALEALILRLLSKRPADRPLSAAAVAEVLEAVAPEEIQLGEPAPGEAPFKGLEYYDVEDADIFFGREALVDRLMERLKGERFLAVIVGASGSGKSSIARAGLVPALNGGKQGDWIFRLMTPTERPLQALADALAPSKPGEAETVPSAEELAQDLTGLYHAAQWLVETEGAKKLLLVVDQLEELFTLCRDEAERAAFIDNLLTAADPETSGPTVVVITLRADFYPHCAAYPSLREALARNQEYIGPMNTSELRRAIEEPALRGGWKFQSGLVDLMLRDVRGEPGALPLLSHALLETWKRRSRRTLTLRGYAEAGGVRRAIARTAEHVYHQRLDDEQRGIARNIFLRLTELGEGTEDTRRRVSHTELIQDPGQNGTTESVLATLAEARLLTLSEEHVEVAHEALIREWPRLREWLDEDREGLRVHRHLTEAAQAWEALERDPGELYRGGRLAQALEWSAEQQPDLNPLEFEFLQASQSLAEQREAEREAQLKRLRRRAIYLGSSLVAAVALAFAAASFGRQASQSAEQADLSLSTAQVANTETASEAMTRATAEAVAIKRQAEAETQAQLARSKELAAAAISVLNENAELSILLALQSIQETPSDAEASASGVLALRDALGDYRLLKRFDTGIGWNRISWDGSTIYSWSNSESAARAIDVVTGDELWRNDSLGETTSLGQVALSSDGKLLAIPRMGGRPADVSDEFASDLDPGRVVILDASNGSVESEIHPGGCPGPIIPSEAFSRDGRWLLVTTGSEKCGSPEEDWLAVYDTSTWEEAYRLMVDGGVIERGRFNVSSDQLFIWSQEGPAELRSFPELQVLHKFGDSVNAGMNPDGRRVVLPQIGSGGVVDFRPRVLDGATGEQLFFLDLAQSVTTAEITFSPDGSQVMVPSRGHDLVFYSEDGRLLADLGELGSTFQASYTDDGERLLTSMAGTSLLWDLSEGSKEQGWGIDISDADVETVWVNPNWHLDGPNMAVQTFIFDNVPGSTLGFAIALLGEDGSVIDHFLGYGAQLADGRFAAIPIRPEGDSRRFGPLVLWDPETGEVIELTQCSALEAVLDNRNPAECPNDEPLFADVDFDRGVYASADGETFAAEGYVPVADDRPIWVWNSGSLEVRSKIQVSWNERLRAVGPTWLVTRRWNTDSLILRDLDSGEVIAELDPGFMIAMVELSPDALRLYGTDYTGSVYAFDTITWNLLASWRAHDTQLRGFVVSPDGERLVTTSNDDSLKVWDVSAIGDQASVIDSVPLLDRIPAARPSDAAWLDEDRLAVFLADGPRLLEVNLSVEDLVASAQERLTRSFTQEECNEYQIDPCPKLEEIKGG